jgi:hypothetical protein
MTGPDYRIAIAKLGMSQRRAARFFEAGRTTGFRWAEEGPPAAVSMLLRLMIVLRITPAWVDYWLGRTKESEDEQI